jgi:predicted small lipoprotein YifL
MFRVLLFSMLISLFACGKTGDLYLPDAKTAATNTHNVAASHTKN